MNESNTDRGFIERLAKQKCDSFQGACYEMCAPCLARLQLESRLADNYSTIVPVPWEPETVEEATEKFLTSHDEATRKTAAKYLESNAAGLFEAVKKLEAGLFGSRLEADRLHHEVDELQTQVEELQTEVEELQGLSAI